MIDHLLRDLQVLRKADVLIAKIWLNILLRRAGLYAFAGLIAVFGLGMANVAAFYALEPTIGPVGAAAIVALSDLVIAAIVLLAASKTRPGAELELASLRRELEACQRFKRLVVLLTLDRGLGARDRRLDLRVLVPGLSRLQVRDVDAKPLADPRKRLFRRPRLPALDLADVLLREPLPRELRLRETGGDAERANPLAEASSRARQADGGADFGDRRVGYRR